MRSIILLSLAISLSLYAGSTYLSKPKAEATPKKCSNLSSYDCNRTKGCFSYVTGNDKNEDVEVCDSCAVIDERCLECTNNYGCSICEDGYSVYQIDAGGQLIGIQCVLE